MSLRFFSKDEWRKLRLEGLRKAVSRKLRDYATPEEVTALKNALEARFYEVEDANPEGIRQARSCIRQMLKLIERNTLPTHIPGAEDILAPFKARYEAARDNVQALDDEDLAWQREIDRRRELEAKYGAAA